MMDHIYTKYPRNEMNKKKMKDVIEGSQTKFQLEGKNLNLCCYWICKCRIYIQQTPKLVGDTLQRLVFNLGNTPNSKIVLDIVP